MRHARSLLSNYAESLKPTPGMRSHGDAAWVLTASSLMSVHALWIMLRLLSRQAEENALRAGRTRVMDGSGGMPSWNHMEYRVRYPSLANQLAVSGIYVKLLLDGLDQVCHVGSWHTAAVCLLRPMFPESRHLGIKISFNSSWTEDGPLQRPKVDNRYSKCPSCIWNAVLELLAFWTHEAHHEYRVLPIGLCNGPSTFQKLINQTLMS